MAHTSSLFNVLLCREHKIHSAESVPNTVAFKHEEPHEVESPYRALIWSGARKGAFRNRGATWSLIDTCTAASTPLAASGRGHYHTTQPSDTRNHILIGVVTMVSYSVNFHALRLCWHVRFRVHDSHVFKLSLAKGGRFPSNPHIHDLETGTLLDGPIHGSGLDSALGLENFNNSIDFCG